MTHYHAKLTRSLREDDAQRMCFKEWALIGQSKVRHILLLTKQPVICIIAVVFAGQKCIRWEGGVIITSVFLVIQRTTRLLKSCYLFQISALTFNDLLLGVGLRTAFFSSNTKLNSKAS